MANQYDDYPDHPLHGIDNKILEAARRVMRDAVTWKDVDPEMAEPLADAVVMNLLPWIQGDA